MAASKAEKLKLLFKDDSVEGQLPKLPVAAEETREEPSRPSEATALTSNQEIPTSYTSYGEDIEPVGYGSDDENLPTAGSVTTSGKRKGKKKGKQGPTSTAAHTAVIRTIQTSDDTLGLEPQLGELALPDEKFCPVLAVSRYPYRHVGKDLSEIMASSYFNAGKFWERTWDIYYIHPPPSVAVKPIFLVPSRQVQTLFKEINEELHCDLTFPTAPRDSGFLISFRDESTPRPRYLGRSRSRNAFDEMTSNAPQEEYRLKTETASTSEPTDRSFKAFKEKMEAALDASKNKSKASKAKKHGERIQQKQKWCRELKRTQRYLGLRPRRTATAKDDPLHKAQLSWTELQDARKEHALAAGQLLPPITVDEAVPYSSDKDVVFICVDVESYERSHNIITEIGISTLDSRDLHGIAPGEDGKAWRDVIHSRHFRIREHAHLINTDFVAGCADRFEFNEGRSDWISIKDAPRTVASCFRPPFSCITSEGPDLATDSSAQMAATPRIATIQESELEKRNIILVGHDISQDINYLQRLGYNPLNLSTLLEIIDTASLYRALTRDNNARSLGTILLDFGIAGWNLHNAGNDAAYTLQALLGIAIRGLGAKREREEREQDMERKVEWAVREAEERVRETAEGWSSPEEGDDGGSPYRLGKAPGGGVGAQPKRGGIVGVGAPGNGKANIERRTVDNKAQTKAQKEADDARYQASLQYW